MFININKKFTYIFSIFFMLIIGLFVLFFQAYYERSLHEDEKIFLADSEPMLELIYENNYLSGQIKNILNNNNRITPPERLKKLLDSDSSEKSKKIISSMNNLYNKKYDRIQNAVKFFAVGLVWMAVSTLLLWIMIHQLVLKSVNKLISVSKQVAKGDFSSRVDMKKQMFTDEFSLLSETFNQMLDNIEENILQIRNNQYFLQSLVDAIPDGIRVIDDEGRIILANKAYKKLFKVESCIGQYCYKQTMNIDHMCSENRFACPLKELKKSNVSDFSAIQYTAKDPNRPLAINAAKMVISDDKTPQKYIIEAIRDLSGDITFSHQQKISSLAFLATSIAHEMKNNLGALRLILEQLIEQKSRINKQEQQKFLQLAYDQLLECIKIPENLLNLSKNSSTNTEINLQEIIAGVFLLLDYDAKRKGIILQTASEENDMFIIGSESDFKMIFLNLCQNAIKAMPNGGVLSVNLRKKGKKAEIILSDTGIGIEKEKLHRIFEPFYSSGKGENSGSTGLGLAIVKSLVESAKGKIKVVSKKGEGTSFTMLFPLR